MSRRDAGPKSDVAFCHLHCSSPGKARRRPPTARLGPSPANRRTGFESMLRMRFLIHLICVNGRPARRDSKNRTRYPAAVFGPARRPSLSMCRPARMQRGSIEVGQPASSSRHYSETIIRVRSRCSGPRNESTQAIRDCNGRHAARNGIRDCPPHAGVGGDGGCTALCDRRGAPARRNRNRRVAASPSMPHARLPAVPVVARARSPIFSCIAAIGIATLREVKRAVAADIDIHRRDRSACHARRTCPSRSRPRRGRTA